MKQQPNVLVLGIGNLLWADEGFGVRAVDTFNQLYSCPDNVTIMDGGTQGLYLVPYVQQADILIVFDAIDYGLEPGTIKQVRDKDVPKFMGAKKMSLHQTGFQEVLATAELLGDYPEKILLVGVQPEEIEDYGGSLRECTKAQLVPCIDIAVQFLNDCGIALTENEQTSQSVLDSVNHPSLDMASYEAHRPSEQVACRNGDDRVLGNKNYTFDPKPVEELSPNLAVKLGQREKA